MKFKKVATIISAAALALALTGCGNESAFDNLFASNSQNGQSSGGTAQESSVSAYSTQSSSSTAVPVDIIDNTTSEEERTYFDSIWDMFDYKKDKSDIAFMSIETDNGVQQMYIPSFEEQLRRYGLKAKVQTDGGLYAFDAADATLAVIPNDDGSTDYQLCDAGVLGAALENKYMQILKSQSTCFGMHLGTSTMFLELQIPDIKQIESDIGNTGKYVLERDDYRFTVYTNGGECFWFIVTVFDNGANADSEGGNTGNTETEPPVISENGEFSMPQLVGHTWNEISALFPDNSVLDLIPEQQWSEEPEGVIIEQEYPEGRKMKAGTAVRVKVSKGIRKLEIQDMTNRTVEAARTQLEKDGFKVSIAYENSNEIPKGNVIRTSPAAYELADSGSSVTLVVSSGTSVSDTVPVPNLVGLSLHEAINRCEEYHLLVNWIVESDSAKKGMVIAQSIPENTSVDKYTEITLTVSEGAE